MRTLLFYLLTVTNACAAVAVRTGAQASPPELYGAERPRVALAGLTDKGSFHRFTCPIAGA